MGIMDRLRRRRDDEPVDPDERSPQLGIKYRDLMVLNALMKAGADLSQTRHVLFCLYATGDGAARAMAEEARRRGYEAEVRPPLPEHPGQWTVVCEIYAVLAPDFVRDSGDFFDQLAAAHEATYDGWEAAV